MAWEYATVDISGWRVGKDDERWLQVTVNEKFEFMGNRGWELVAVYDGVAFFKRKKDVNISPSVMNFPDIPDPPEANVTEL